jgi:hypothetical protein
VLIALVCGIGVILGIESMPSIQKFGLNFWRTEIWDPVSGSSARCRSSGARCISSVLALLIATPIALGIAIFISELCPAALRQPLVFITELLAAIPSIVYGLWGIFVLVPAVRAVETSLPASLRALPLFSVRRSGSACSPPPDSRDHGDPVRLLDLARGAQVGAAGAARRRRRSAPPASRRSAPPCSTRAPASSAP